MGTLKMYIYKQYISVDMFGYAIDNPAPATVILISGDRDFAYAVSVLRLRRYQVVIVAPSVPSPHASLKSQASAVLEWDADILGRQKAVGNLSTTDSSLCISDLFRGKPEFSGDMRTCTSIKTLVMLTWRRTSEDTERNAMTNNDGHALSNGSPEAIARRVTAANSAPDPGPSESMISRPHANSARKDPPTPATDLVVASNPIALYSPPTATTRNRQNSITGTERPHPSLAPHVRVIPAVPMAKPTIRPISSWDHVSHGGESRTHSQTLNPPKRRSDSKIAPNSPIHTPVTKVDYVGCSLLPQMQMSTAVASDMVNSSSIDTAVLIPTDIVHKASAFPPSKESQNHTESPQSMVFPSSDSGQTGGAALSPATSLPPLQFLGTRPRHSEHQHMGITFGTLSSSTSGISSSIDEPQPQLRSSLLSPRPVLKATPGVLQANIPILVDVAPNSTPPKGNPSTSFPPMFQPLVECLDTLRSRGHVKPLRSLVGCQLLMANKSVYQQLGITGFSEYVTLAEKIGIVQLGGTGGKAWILLLLPGRKGKTM